MSILLLDEMVRNFNLCSKKIISSAIVSSQKINGLRSTNQHEINTAVNGFCVYTFSYKITMKYIALMLAGRRRNETAVDESPVCA